MSMSVTDRYTQSQTRLHNSVTELNVATALWRRNAANAHLAAVMGPSLRRHCRQSSSYSVRDSILADRVVMSSLSTLSQSEQEIALLAIEGHVTWTLDTIESSITVDIKDANPGFGIDTHVGVYDQEIKDIEAETQQTIKSIEDQLKVLSETTEELVSGQGSGVSAHRQTIIDTHTHQTEFITQQVESMSFCDGARDELTAESNLLRQTWTGRKSDYWESPAVKSISKKLENVSKARTRHEHDLEQFFDHHTLGSSTSDYAKPEKHKLTLASGLGKDESAGSKQIQIFDMFLQGRGNEYWSIIPDLTRVGHDIDPTECKTWCPPRIDSID